MTPPAAPKPRARSPQVEGEPIETLFGLNQGLLRYQLKKRSKPYLGKVVRITGVVKYVHTPTPETKYAWLKGRGQQVSGVSLMCRVQFEPDYARLAPGRQVRAACVFRGNIEPDFVQFEDCRFTP